MTDYQRVAAERPWAELVSYSRAVRRGNLVEVGGTSATLADGTVVCPGDPYGQTKHILDEMEAALHQLGASLADVVRTRAFLTRAADWEHVGRAHGEAFGTIAPASTMVEVSALLLPDLVVEIEATALISNLGEGGET